MLQSKIILFYFILSIFLLSSCQKTLVKNSNTEMAIDSMKYFSNIEINDPFLEKLNNTTNDTFILKKTLIPQPIPEPVKSKYKTIEGYRVQIFAGVDSINALASKNLANTTVADTIYSISEKGLYKLQVGDYPYYPQADSIKRKFRQSNFPGAWIVKTNILIPIKETELDSINKKTNGNSKGKFRIQVLATGDENKAQLIVNKLKMQFSGKASYEKSGNIFKVFVGYYKNRDEARNVLKTIRETEYPDAWMVY